MWTRNEALVAELRQRLAQGLKREDGHLAALESLGRLSFAGVEGCAERLDQEQRSALCALGDRGALGPCCGMLLPAMVELPAVLDALLDDATDVQLAGRAVGWLEHRDRLAFVLEGIRVATGAEAALDADQRSSLLAFDALLADRPWRLVLLGEQRAEHVGWVAPHRRCELWWWNRGMDLSASAAESLGLAARLIHVFPEARDELEQLVLAERDLAALVASEDSGAGGAHIISIAEYLRRRAGCAAAAEDRRAVAVACADDERVVHRREDITVSITDHELILDYEEGTELPGSTAPSLAAEGLAPLEARATLPGRFELPLSAPHFEHERAVLRVPLRDAVIELTIPFDEG